MTDNNQSGMQGQVMEVDTALALLDGDRDLLKELVVAFLEDYPRLQAQISRSIREKDGPSLRRAAHTLKSGVASFAAQPACEVAASLELIGESGELDRAPATWTSLQREIERLRPELSSLL